MKLEIHVHRLPGDDDHALEERLMASVSEKIAALKAEFDAALARVEARLADKEATDDADMASLDDMMTRAKGLAAEPTPSPAPPVEPAPPVPPSPTT